MKPFNKLITIGILTMGISSAFAVSAAGSTIGPDAVLTAPVVPASGSSAKSVASGVAGSAGGYVGPSTVPAMTVHQLLTSGVDDQYVKLTGKLVRHIGGEHYILADASGEVQVEISAKHLPAHQKMDATTLVEVSGKFDKSRFGTSELDVELVSVLPR